MAQNPNPSLLDPGQIIKRVMNETDDAIRVEGDITIVEQAIGVPGSPAPAELKMAGGEDNLGDARPLRTDANGELQVDILTSALPSGASTEATLSALNAKVVKADTDDVTITSSVLPTGASTSALQTDGNASLSSIDSKLTSPLVVTGPLTDTQLRAAAVPVSAASLPLPAGASTEVTLAALVAKSAASLVPNAFDEQVITYVGITSDIDTVTYRLANTTVAVLALSYDGQNRLVGVVKT